MYTPPYPFRPSRDYHLLKFIWTARKNLVALWPADTFVLNNFSFTLFRRHIHFVTVPETVKEVFVDGGTLFEQKTEQLKNALRPLIGDGLFISDGDTWRTRRRILAPITHASRLPDLAPVISAGAGALSAEWAKKAGRETDVLADTAMLTVGIIVRSVFGRTLDTRTIGELVAAFGTYRGLSDQTGLLSLLGFSSLPRPRGLRTILAARRIHRIIEPLIDKLLDEPDAHSGSTSILAAMVGGGLGGTDRRKRRALRDEAAVMILAGYEGSANTLAWAFFILSRDPDAERRLHEEVDAVLGDEPAGFDDYPKLPFTRAIIEETLRLYPPIPFQGRVATRDGILGDLPIKKGDLVILNAWIMHRRAALWTDADAFVPDRFLTAKRPWSRYGYVPFSIGPRVCTGAAFGLLELVLCLATLARGFRLRLRRGFEVHPVCRLSLRPGEHLPMVVEPRRRGDGTAAPS